MTKRSVSINTSECSKWHTPIQIHPPKHRSCPSFLMRIQKVRCWSLHMAIHQNAPPPSLYKKRPLLHPPTSSTHMYERKQSCIKVGDLLPLGQLTQESHFILFLGTIVSKLHFWRTLANESHSYSNMTLLKVDVFTLETRKLH